MINKFFAWLGLTLGTLLAWALAYHWGYYWLEGYPPTQHTIDVWDSLFGIFLVACCLQVWNMWRKG